MGNSDRRKFIDTFLRMNPVTWLTLAIAVLSFSTPASSSEPRVVCYYTNWSVYRPGTARFNPQNINPYLCTHLIYAFGGFTKENTLKPFDKYQDIEKGGYAKFTGLKTYNRNLKTLLAIGGWNEGSARFSPMVASKGHRREFVRNAIKFLRQNHFDGLDLDWEYPAFRDGGKPKDRDNYAHLVKELREEFERESEKTGKPRLLLTMAVPAGIEYIQKGFDVKTLNQYLDWMNLLTYDYHSAFEPAVNHHAPLYPIEEPNEYSVDDELNIDYTIKYYIENGADRDKLVLGIPTYGRSYTLFNPDATDLGSPADGPGEQGDATREKGYLAYYEICESLKPKEKKPKSSEEDEDDDESSEEDEPWTLVQPNTKAMGPFAYRGNQWVGYDDVDIVKKKAEYVAENGLGGIMFWSIDNDDFRGNCHGKPYPLIEAAKEAYIIGLGSDNAIAERLSSTTSRSSTRRRNRPRSSTTTTTAKPSAAKSNKRKPSSSVSSTTPSWNIVTPEPPTTPDPGSDFKCTDEGFFPHPRDCKKYFWCLDSGPSNLGIVAHAFTCPSGLFFNKAADSCDFARNVHCKKPAETTKAPATTSTSTTTRKPIKVSTKSSVQFRTKSTTTTPEPQVEEEYEDTPDDEAEIDSEDPKVIKELIDLIRKVGGVEQLEKQLHLSETSSSADSVSTTASSPFNKKLYQKVLERARGKSRLSNTLESLTQNSRRGPQNSGLEATADKDVLLKKDRPQYTTIQRSRPSTEAPEDINEDDEDSTPQSVSRARAVNDVKVGTTARALQYVNIRRARPNDAADDSASRNALFERPESIVSLSETPNSLDISSARRENIPEYVTIRRQRPTTEEATTIAYQVTEDSEVETQETALEREISSPVQSQYKSIIRSRPTTSIPVEINSPEPTTVLAVQISSLLNSPSEDETAVEVETTLAEAETETTSPTSSTTSTLPPSSSSPPRRIVQRRRGSTTTTTPQPSTEVSSRNYNIIRRRRPLAQQNEIISDSDETLDVSRTVRSTTPDSREVNGFRIRDFRRTRTRVQVDDNVPAEDTPTVARGQFRSISRDESFDNSETPQFIPRQSFSPRSYRGRTSTTASDVQDSKVSAATIESRRPVSYRGRNKFSISTTDADLDVDPTESPVSSVRSFSRFSPRSTVPYEQVGTTQASPRRPFTRFSPRPFSKAPIEENIEEETIATSRAPVRLPFSRGRPLNQITSTTAPSSVPQQRRFAFPSRQTTTPLLNNNEEEDELEKVDDITLSESAIAEKEHEEHIDDDEEPFKRRVIIKKKVRPTDSAIDSSISTEAVPIVDENGRKKIRVLRRRPSSTTPSENSPVTSEAPISSTPQRIRKVIRKKIKPTDDEPEIIAKSIGSLSSDKDSTTELIVNYGEKTRPSVVISTTQTPIPEEDPEPTESAQDLTSNPDEKIEALTTQDHEKKTETDFKPEVIVETDKQAIEVSENKENAEEPPVEEAKEVQTPETTTTSSTVLTSPSPRTRLPYRPPKRLFTSTTEAPPKSSRTFSRKFNPGVYTSPATVGRNPESPVSASPRRPLFTPRTFTRRPFTAKTTKKVEEEEEEEEYSDEDVVDEEPENQLVLVQGQLFSRRPRPGDQPSRPDEEDNGEEDVDDEVAEEEVPKRFPTSRKSIFKPKVINSNTFRTSTSTTEIPKRLGSSQNKTSIYNRFASVKPVNDPKKRVQNVPVGYSAPKVTQDVNETESHDIQVSESHDGKETGKESNEIITTTNISTDSTQTTTEDDDYLTMTETESTTNAGTTNTDYYSTNGVESETSTNEVGIEIDDSTDDYLEFTDSTTNLPTTQFSTTNVQTDTEIITVHEVATTIADSIETTTESLQETTTSSPPVSPVVKTQYNKLFSVSRIVEVSSKLDKHRLDKNNKTKLVEEGKIMVEKKPKVDQIGEVSRYSLIKIVEDEIPIYLTKLGHVYPVENPPDNLIRIDEARNARALMNFADAPRENLIASESMNEAYRHINKVRNQTKDDVVAKNHIEHVSSDDFLSYINIEKKDEKSSDESYPPWQFVPAAYENDRIKAARSFEIITPRTLPTEPSTLPLEALFKTENPVMARKINENDKQPFLVYSAPTSTQKKESNLVKLEILKPETGRSIVTFAKGQEFNGGLLNPETTVKYPINISVIPKTSETTGTTNNVSATTETMKVATMSPILEMLTTMPTTINTDAETTIMSTTEIPTTETVPEETTTIKSLFGNKRKFAFPRRPAIKPSIVKSNVTRLGNLLQTNKKSNSTVSLNSLNKANKTSSLVNNKSRFSANRAVNVPVDVRKKTPGKLVTKTFTTEAPKTTTERKAYFKPIRPGVRPAFFPRRLSTTPSTTVASET